jgi:hypothetical protein
VNGTTLAIRTALKSHADPLSKSKQSLVQAVKITGAIFQQQRRRTLLPGAMTVLDEVRKCLR